MVFHQLLARGLTQDLRRFEHFLVPPFTSFGRQEQGEKAQPMRSQSTGCVVRDSTKVPTRLGASGLAGAPALQGLKLRRPKAAYAAFLGSGVR